MDLDLLKAAEFLKVYEGWKRVYEFEFISGDLRLVVSLRRNNSFEG